MILKDCSSCLVYTANGKRLSMARVAFGNDKVNLYFNNYKMSDARMRSQVDFYDDQVGLIQAFCDLLIRRNPAFPEMVEPWMAECNIVKVANVIQRQRDIRVKVNLEIQFHSEKHGNFYGTMKNLSAGGMFLATTQALDRNEIITFNHSFRTLERKFEAVALWVKRIESGEFGYGCKFIRLTAGGEAAIREYVYRIQLEKDRNRE